LLPPQPHQPNACFERDGVAHSDSGTAGRPRCTGRTRAGSDAGRCAAPRHLWPPTPGDPHSRRASRCDRMPRRTLRCLMVTRGARTSPQLPAHAPQTARPVTSAGTQVRRCLPQPPPPFKTPPAQASANHAAPEGCPPSHHHPFPLHATESTPVPAPAAGPSAGGKAAPAGAALDLPRP
jgi:hypothetical protein